MKAAEKLAQTDGSYTCLALVKPRSELAREIGACHPVYAIFEFESSAPEAVLKFGDGSWHRLDDEKELDDLVIIEELGEPFLDRLFDS